MTEVAETRTPWVLYGAVAVLPVLLSEAAVHHWLGRDLWDYTPVQSDDLSYWHQIVTFSRVGFHNGYYSYQEQLAPALSAYGFWGPVLPLLYGCLVALVGASATVVVDLNVLVLVACVGAAMAVARPGRRRTLLVAALVGTCVPLLFYIPTGMQETVHYGLAVLLAALFHRLMRAGPGARTRPTGWLVAVILLGALLRAPWGILLIPAGVLACRGNPRRAAAAAGAGAAGAVCLGLLFSIWSAPYPYVNLDKIRFAATLHERVSALVATIGHNVRQLPQFQPVWLIGNAQRYQVIVVVVVGLGLLGAAWRRQRRDEAMLAGVVTAAVLLPVGLVIAVYEIAAGTRILGPHLLFAGVLVALHAPRGRLLALPVLLVVTGLAAVPLLRTDVITIDRANFLDGVSARAVTAFHGQLGGQLAYRPGADRWCNTLLVSTDPVFFPELRAVPPGIGVSVDIDHVFGGPLKSAYVLANDVRKPLLPDGGARLVPLARTSRGTLYRNPDSPCFTPR
jgi:hypothetical protein